MLTTQQQTTQFNLLLLHPKLFFCPDKDCKCWGGCLKYSTKAFELSQTAKNQSETPHKPSLLQTNFHFLSYLFLNQLFRLLLTARGHTLSTSLLCAPTRRTSLSFFRATKNKERKAGGHRGANNSGQVSSSPTPSPLHFFTRARVLFCTDSRPPDERKGALLKDN